MPRQRARQSQIEALLALYQVNDVTSLDVETVASTYSVPEDVAIRAFESAVDNGFLKSESGLFLLTTKGANEIDQLFTRGAGTPQPVLNRPAQPS